MTEEPRFVPLEFVRYSDDEQLSRSRRFLDEMRRRRTVRSFSREPIPDELIEDGAKTKHYYVRESVGIAVGLLLASLHHAGVATLTHTPSPMGFLREILGRPENERPYALIPVGYPAAGCTVPVLDRKPVDEILVRREELPTQ